MLRDPRHPDWPLAGAQTDDGDTAREWAWAYVTLLRETGTDDRPATHKLGKAIDAYIKDRKRKRAKNTVINDKTALNWLAEWAGRDMPTDRLLVRHDKRRVAGYLYLQDLVNERVEQGYASSTLNTYVAAWAGFFEWLGSKVNAYDISVPEDPDEDVRPWSDAEAKDLRDAADAVDRLETPGWPSARLVVEFFLASGCRAQEGFAAERQRIRPDECTIRLVAQLERWTNVLVPLKGKKARTALLLPSFWPYHQKGTGFVLGVDGEAFGKDDQRKLLDAVLKQAGLKEYGVGYHRFRHTYARWFIEAGGRLEELQKSLGHISITTTEKYYGWLSEETAAVMAKGRIYGHLAQHPAQKRKT